jgi:pimeloyl-ACP methyl ester carboxylesterase
MKYARYLSAIAILVALSVSAPTPARAVVDSRFQNAPCPFKPGQGMIVGQNLHCGYVSEPEDHAKPHGAGIKIAVAVFTTPSSQRAPDPVVFLQGGPGGRIIADLAPLINSGDAATFMGNHDLILIDQRGTGFSRPNLACPEMTALKYRYLDVNISLKKSAALQAVALGTCRRRLTAQRVNIADYTTLQDAADIAGLRTALGYSKLDLYGVSYGTRVALTVMRAFPGGIRSVVLDSVVPPQFNLLSDAPRSSERGFQTIFQGCSQAPECRGKYPTLRTDFTHAISTLDSHPVTVVSRNSNDGKRYRVLLDGYGLATVVFSAMYDTSELTYLPSLIHQADRGSYGLAAAIFGVVGFNDALISDGDYFSVECSEDAPFTGAAQIRASVISLPPVLRSKELTDSLDTLGLCSAWPMPSTDPVQKKTVKSAIPTLVLSGEYDPITPPAGSKAVSRSLSNSFFFEFPGTGHAVYLTSLCPNDITQAFYDRPGRRPDSSCIAHMREPFGPVS